MQLFNTLCSEPRCGRRAFCLPAIELSYNPRKALLLERYRPDLGISLHDRAHQIYLPLRPRPIHNVLKGLRESSRSPWRPICLRCLAVAYVRTVRYRRKLKCWSGQIFNSAVSQLLRRLRRNKQPEKAIERAYPMLVKDIKAEFRRLWNVRGCPEIR